MHPIFDKHDLEFSFNEVSPLSLIKTLGTPNLGKITLLKNLVPTRASFVGLTAASTHLEM